MTVEDILMPQESVRYNSSKRVKVVGAPHNVLVTSHRFILWRKSGLLGRLQHSSYRLQDVNGVELNRGGLLGNASIRVLTPATSIKLEGPKSELVAIHQHLNQALLAPA